MSNTADDDPESSRHASDDRESPSHVPEPFAPNAFRRTVELLLYSVGPITTLATAPILAHGLGPEGRGQYGVAIAVATLVATLGGWGQAEIFLNRSRAGTDHYRLHSRITWVGGLIASVVCAAVMLGLNLPWSATLVTCIWIPLLTQMGLWRAASISRSRLKAPALDSALGSLLKLVSVGLLALLAVLTVDSALFAYQGALAIGSILTVGLASRHLGLRTHKRSDGPTPLLVGGIAIISFNLLHAITLRADLIVLQLVAAPTEVGLYAAPASLTTAALALSTAYKPRVQVAALSNSPLRGILRNCLQVVALGGLGTAVLWIATPLVVSIMFGASFSAAEPIMRMLIFAIVPLLLVDLIFAALIVLGRRRDLLLVAGGGATLNVAALCILCPVWGAFGAAMATVISYALTTIFGWLVLAQATRQLDSPDDLV